MAKHQGFPRRVVLVSSVSLHESGTPLLAERWGAALRTARVAAEVWPPLICAAASPIADLHRRLETLQSLDRDGAIVLLGLPKDHSLANAILVALHAAEAPSAVLWERPGFPISDVHIGLKRFPCLLITLSADHRQHLERLDIAPVRQAGLAVPRMYFTARVSNPSPPHYAVFVGRFTASKNVELLVHRWVEHIHPSYQLPLRLAGAGLGDDTDTEARIQAFANQHPEAVSVCRLGDDSERSIFLAKASLAVFPGRHDHLPQAMLEAMALGLPVVGSAIRGHLDALRDGDNGYLCSTNLEDLGELVQAIIAKPSRSERIGRRGQKYAQTYHSG